VIVRVIVVDGEVAGTIGSLGDPDEREVTYWIGRSYWGKGIATGALKAFLTIDPSRPLRARVADDNVASRRVLEKCGFRVVATERGFAEARSGEIEEFVLRLEDLPERRGCSRVSMCQIASASRRARSTWATLAPRCLPMRAFVC
jgi:RimJ/RimL family protein N-acetyltransferase